MLQPNFAWFYLLFMGVMLFTSRICMESTGTNYIYVKIQWTSCQSNALMVTTGPRLVMFII